jgi:hypothetical protein
MEIPMERAVSVLTAMALSALVGSAAGRPVDGGRGMDADGWAAVAPEVGAVAPAPVAAPVEIPRGLAAAIMATIDDPTLDVRKTVAACYSAENPPSQEVIDWMEMNLYGGGEDYQLNSRWTGSQGDPVNLSWSFVPDGLSIPNGIGEGTANSELFSRLDAQFAGQGGRATWIARIQSVFDRWQELSGVNYTRITFNGNEWDDGASWSSSGAASRGDIRISMKNIDGGSGILAYNFFPGSGSGGNMVLDRSENWSSSPNTNRFMRNIIAHENGHGLGINHVCPANQSKLLEPFISTAYDGVRHDELRGIQRHYGDPYEPNNNFIQAADLGVLAGGTVTRPSDIPGVVIPNSALCSIDANSETDYYKFTLSGPASITVTLAPVGHTYLQGPQQGNCNTGSNYNSLTTANLSLYLIDTDGTSILASSDGNPVGQGEEITYSLGAGTFYVRVSEADAPSQSQLYSLAIDVSESEKIYMGFTNIATVPGLGSVQNEDIVKYDPGSNTWSMIFDGSDVGLSAAVLDGFTITPDGETLLLSFNNPIDIPGLIGGPNGTLVDDSDIVQFFPVSLGVNTSGAFSFYFDASDVGLDTNGEDINAIGFSGDGDLIVSTVGSAIGTGASWVRQDLVEFTDVQLGANTSGSFAMLFDGSDVNMADLNENIDGATMRGDGTLMLTTFGPFSVTGAAGTSQDLLLFTPAFLGANTSGVFELFLDLSSVGIDPTENVIGLTMATLGPEGDILGCLADLTNDEVLDIFDFLAFQSLFAQGDLGADFDGDGELSVFDFLEFQNLFEAGC